MSFIHFQESLETLTLKLANHPLTFSPFSFHCCGLSTCDSFLFISLLSCIKKMRIAEMLPPASNGVALSCNYYCSYWCKDLLHNFSIDVKSSDVTFTAYTSYE